MPSGLVMLIKEFLMVVPVCNFKIEDKIKTQLEIMKRIDSHIASTNAKCAIAMSYCAAVLGWLAVNSSKMISEIDEPNVRALAGIFLVIGITFTVVCLVLSLKITYPVTYSSQNEHRGESMVFFGDIASQSRHTYSAQFLALDSEGITNDLSEQIHTLSGIADKKFVDLQTLTIMLCFGSVLPIGLFILLKIFDKF